MGDLWSSKVVSLSLIVKYRNAAVTGNNSSAQIEERAAYERTATAESTRLSIVFHRGLLRCHVHVNCAQPCKTGAITPCPL